MAYYHQHKKLLHNILNSNIQFDLIIPFHGFQNELIREMEYKSVEILAQLPRAILTKPLKEKLIWSQDWWPNCIALNCQSLNTENTNEKISIDFLKSQKNWGVYYQIEQSKLADRVFKKIKSLAIKRITYQPNNPFNFKFFTWSAILNYIIFCEKPFQRFPLGWHEFIENKNTPPNRAYLKLWELFSIYNLSPPNLPDILEIGASPGGWSWVLSEYARTVFTVDRANLDPQITSIKNIIHSQSDAFKLDTNRYQTCTWFFSDLICTPEKIYETIQFWLNNSSIKNFICTIKFKGNCDFNILNMFLQIEGSKIIRLYQNKHEVTWIKTTN